MEIKELRARSIGIVGIKIARELPYEKAVNGAQAHFPAFLRIPKQPGILRGGEIGRERQPRSLAHKVRIRSERVGNILPPRTLPHDGICKRALIVPHTARLPLVGDADRFHARGILPHALAGDKKHVLPDLIEVMGDISPPVDDLPVRPCGARDHPPLFIEKERLRALRALVDTKYRLHASSFFTRLAMPSAVSP